MKGEVGYAVGESKDKDETECTSTVMLDESGYQPSLYLFFFINLRCRFALKYTFSSYFPPLSLAFICCVSRFLFCNFFPLFM